MRPDSYRRIARLLRGIADRLDLYAESTDPHHAAATTRLLNGLRHQARDWWQRHCATRDDS